MDLKEVIERVKTAADSAHSSFHAGRRDDAKNYLADIRAILEAFCEQPATPASDVTESATSEKPADETKEAPAQGPGAQVRPAAVLPEKPVQQAAEQPESQKQTR